MQPRPRKNRIVWSRERTGVANPPISSTIFANDAVALPCWREGFGEGGTTQAKSNIEKHGLVITLKVDIEAIDRAAVAMRAPCSQRGAALGWHQRQHGIAGIGRLAVEINSRIVMQQHAARENREQNMR